MCYLTQEAIQQTPELALHGLVFSKSPAEHFSIDSLQQELSNHQVSGVSREVISSSIETWLENERIFRVRGDRNQYRVAARL